MAQHIGLGVLKVREIKLVVKPVQELDVEELLNYEGIIIGSPTYYGSMASEVSARVTH